MSLALEPHRIELDDLVLRPFVASDEAAVAEALRDPDILRWTAGTAVVRTPADQRARRWLEFSLDHALVNVGSCRVATRAGFQLEGVIREYFVEITGERHDSHLHARLATDQLPAATAGS